MREQWRGGLVGRAGTACYREGGKRRSIDKDAYRLSRDGEGGNEPMTLAHMMETSFTGFFLFLPIHNDLHNVFEILLL